MQRILLSRKAFNLIWLITYVIYLSSNYFDTVISAGDSINGYLVSPNFLLFSISIFWGAFLFINYTAYTSIIVAIRYKGKLLRTVLFQGIIVTALFVTVTLLVMLIVSIYTTDGALIPDSGDIAIFMTYCLLLYHVFYAIYFSAKRAVLAYFGTVLLCCASLIVYVASVEYFGTGGFVRVVLSNAFYPLSMSFLAYAITVIRSMTMDLL